MEKRTIIFICLLGVILIASFAWRLLLGTETVAYPEHMKQKDVIVIAAPSVHNEYYAENFTDIIDFNVAYASAVSGKDDIRILVDEDTRSFFSGRVPAEVLVTTNVEDIWLRDFGTVNPHNPVQFQYSAASFEGEQREAEFVQESFTRFASSHNLTFSNTDLIIDGGNTVDNYAGRVVTTERFLEDNNLTKAEGVAALKEVLDASEVAILPPDDPVLAHSDGMVMFIEENVLAVNRYDEPFRTQVLTELENAFPGIVIIEIEAVWEDETWDGTIGSACGITVNSVVTTNYIYVPHFGNEKSDQVIETIKTHTAKTVIPIPAQNVCKMGGSVRCLSWQLSGTAAAELLSNL